MINLPKRLLVMEGYNPAGIELLAEAGATHAAVLYKDMLADFVDPDIIDIAEISGEAAPQINPDLYSGVCWTGSNLFFSSADAVVQRHIDWCRKFFELGIPQIGSCWGAQLAAVAAGGKCELNPKGREFGIGRKILLNDAGRAHPMFKGKRAVFDAPESHADIVTELPHGATLLAGNAMADVQALEVRMGQGTFWAFQYHPEYDLAEVAALSRVRADGLVEQGSFPNLEAAATYAAEFDTLCQDPARADLRFKWAVDEDVMDRDFRFMEIRNWLEFIAGER